MSVIVREKANRIVISEGQQRVVVRASESRLSNQLEQMSTTQNINIDIDPVNGNDVFALVFDQASADAHGPFATIAGATRALPNGLRHFVVLRLVDGQHALDFNTDFSRFFWGYGNSLGGFLIETGFLTMTSLNGRVIQPGTASMAVTSSSGAAGAHVVTLQADPLLTANAFRRAYLTVTAGTGVGQFKPIRSHVGPSFNVAGTFNPALDATSVVEIRAPAATIQFTGDNDRFSFNRHGVFFGVEFRNVDLTNPNATAITTWDGGTVFLTEGARVFDMLWDFRCANLLLDDCVVAYDAAAGVNLLNFTGGICRTKTGSSRPHYFDTTTLGNAIQVFSRDDSSGLFVFGGHQFDGFSASALVADGPMTQVDLSASGGGAGGAFPATDGSIPTALVVRNGATFMTDAGDLAGLDTNFNGATQDVLLDGAAVDWATIDADANDRAVGAKGSRIFARL